MEPDPQAKELNRILAEENPRILDLLSPKGRRTYFPKAGILSQSAEAASAELNATIGTALEDDGDPMALRAVRGLFHTLPLSALNYAPSAGRPAFRKAWRDLLLAKNPSLAGKPFSLPVATAGLTHGLSVTAHLFLDAEDTVVLPDLHWENYDLLFDDACGCHLLTYPLFRDEAYNIDGLDEAISRVASPKVTVLLNFPHNPTGYSPTLAEAEAIAQVLRRHAETGRTILALVDDAYFGLVYEESVLRESLFALLADLHPNLLAVKIDGPTKEDYVWGLRLAFVTVACRGGSRRLYEALEAKFAGAVRATVSNTNNLGQEILLRAWASPDYAEDKHRKFLLLKERYRTVRRTLAEHPEYAERFRPLPFNSGYFMCVRFDQDADPVRRILLERYGVGTVVFGSVMRLAYSSVPTKRIPDLFDRIYRASLDT